VDWASLRVVANATQWHLVHARATYRLSTGFGTPFGMFRITSELVTLCWSSDPVTASHLASGIAMRVALRAIESPFV